MQQTIYPRNYVPNNQQNITIHGHWSTRISMNSTIFVVHLIYAFSGILEKDLWSFTFSVTWCRSVPLNKNKLQYFHCLFAFSPTTFHTVFWSLFSLGEPTAVELGAFNHYFTQNVGYWIFGAYNIATVIVLLNMLIAMMSRSFEKIQVKYCVKLVLRKGTLDVRTQVTCRVHCFRISGATGFGPWNGLH